MPHDRAIWRQVAELHASALDQGFLSTLGPAVLTELYRAIDTGPDSVLIVTQTGGQVSGFVSGSPGMGPVYRQMLRRPLRLGLALLPLLLAPRKVLGILEILRHGRKAGPAGVPDLPRHELLSIAVTPAARGSGVAEQLYRGLSAHFRTQGVEAFRIVVGDSLAPAHRFYTRMGALPVGRTVVHGDQGSVIYRQAI